MSTAQNKKENNITNNIADHIKKSDLDATCDIALKLNGDEEVVIKIKKSIPFTERMELIKDIVNTVFIGENNNVDDYQSFLINFAKEYAIVSHYVCNLELPTDINMAHKFLTKMNLFEIINKTVGKEIVQILEEVDLMINAKLKSLINNNGIRDFIKRLDGFLDGLSKIFDGVDLGEMMGVLQKIPTNISEKEIINTIIEDKNLFEKEPK